MSASIWYVNIVIQTAIVSVVELNLNIQIKKYIENLIKSYWPFTSQHRAV